MIFKEKMVCKNEIFIILRATSDKEIDIKDINLSKIWKKGDNKLPNNNVLKHHNFGFEISKKIL
ncbi:hypothetical protein LMG7974_01183 [Campylobacter majalis]|uniref:Uncharacterized protein n=1 Tax=Campylobacter majalis TaxID=2790656 RepID=A0ABN7KC27_9BACT|nr:hypothetical protein LMG7974_01183 [Campylobacter majalis]